VVVAGWALVKVIDQEIGNVQLTRLERDAVGRQLDNWLLLAADEFRPWPALVG